MRSCKPEEEFFNGKCRKKCKPNQARNPETNRCKDITRLQLQQRRIDENARRQINLSLLHPNNQHDQHDVEEESAIQLLQEHNDDLVEENRELKINLNVLQDDNRRIQISLADIVDKLRICNSRPRNTNTNTDITGMSNFISERISKMNANDVIMAEEVNVGEYLKDDKDNIVFVIDGRFPTIINKQDMNLEDPTSLFYECIEANSAFSQDDNITGPKLFSLKKIGSIRGGLIWLEDVQKIKENTTKNAFVLEEVKRIETIVSMDVIENQNLVSGTHCQPGLNDTVYKLSFGIHM